MKIRQIIEKIKLKMDKVGGLQQVFYVGCGGSLAALYPSYYLLNSESKTFGVSLHTSNEFVHATPQKCNEQSICIICSRNATAETVEAVKKANSLGAITIAMTGSPETEMASTGQYTVVYSNGDNQIISQANQGKGLEIGFEILQQFEEYENYDKAMEAFTKIDQIVDYAKEYIKPIALKFAHTYKDSPLFYVLASGSCYGVAYTMSCCHLMEMQWKHGVTMHTGEYFHGPFETTDKNLPMILLISEGRTRSLDERCLKFLDRYAENITTIDAKELGINVIDDAVVEFFNPVVMIPIERLMVSKMAEIRNHSMDQRRYMWKVEY